MSDTSLRPLHVRIVRTSLADEEEATLNPSDYLTDVLTRIADYPQSKVADLLPHRWKAARDAAPKSRRQHETILAHGGPAGNAPRTSASELSASNPSRMTRSVVSLK